MTEWLVGIGVVLVGLPLVVWLSHRMLVTSPGGGAGGSDAFGGLVDAFEPARARADRDLDTHHTLRQALPSPGDHDDPGPESLDGGTIRIRRPGPRA